VARRRAQLSAWQRRNRLAQQRGYKNYYDYRTHNYGARPPSQPRARGAELRRLRGHASAADLKRAAPRAQFATMGEVERDEKTGEFKRIRIDLIAEDGSEREFWLSGKQLTDDELEALRDEIEAAGGRVFIWYPAGSVAEEALESAA